MSTEAAAAKAFNLRDESITYYGPHECGGCGRKVVRSSLESGGHRFDVPEGPEPIYPNTVWPPHECDHSAPAAWLQPLSATTPDSNLEPVPPHAEMAVDEGEGPE